MSRFGWMYANSAMTGTVANGPTNSIQINSGSQVLTGTSNFTYNPVTNTVTLAGLMTGSSLVISASVISASTYLGIVGGGSSTPGGTNTTIQFNSGSTFSGSTNLIYNYTTNVLSGTTVQFTVVTASAYSGGSFIGTTVSGTTAQFTILTGSTVTGSTALFNVITASAYSGGSFVGSTVSGTTAQFTILTASVVSASTYLGITAGATPGGTNTAIQFNSGSSLSGSSNLIFNYTTNVLSGTTAQFTSITASVISASGDIQTGGGLSAFGNINTQGRMSAQAIAGRYRTFAGDFSVATNSWFCAIDSSGAVVTASLGSSATYYPGQQMTFKDVGGFAGTNNILIKASGSQTIDGASGVSLTTNSSSVTIISDGSSTFYIVGII